MVKVALLIVVILSLESCSWYESAKFQHDLKNYRKEAFSKIDKEKCTRENGKIEGVGMFGTPSCVHYYSDAGKPCTRKTDCQGYCMGKNDQLIGELSSGTCEKSEQDQFGCFTIIEDGKVLDGICQD